MMCPRSGQSTAEDGRVTQQELLSQVVSDFDVLYRAYARAGLLAEEAHTETAQKLLGSGDDVYRFKRAFLLAEALMRYGVGRRSTAVLPPDMVLWDMPDCDATESRKYMYAVVEAVTVADALVYVTS